MLRTTFLTLMLCCAALAQPAPVRQFLLRIEPVRSGFTLQNMTPEESGIANQHFAYLQKVFAEGKLTFAGQAFDPKGLFGVIVVNAPDADTAAALLNGDPAVKAKLFRGDVIPFRTVLERGAPAPK